MKRLRSSFMARAQATFQIALFGAVLVSCGSLDGRGISDEESARQRDRAIAYQQEAAIKGRQNWERALASGEKVFTIHGEGVRLVVTDVQLFDDRVCRKVLAVRGSSAWDDFWENRDAAGLPPPQVSCSRYYDVDIFAGDGRRK